MYCTVNVEIYMLCVLLCCSPVTPACVLFHLNVVLELQVARYCILSVSVEPNLHSLSV